MIDLFSESDYDPDHRKAYEDLLAAAECGDVDAAKAALERGAYCFENVGRALLVAAESEQNEIVALLLDPSRFEPADITGDVSRWLLGTAIEKRDSALAKQFRDAGITESVGVFHTLAREDNLDGLQFALEQDIIDSTAVKNNLESAIGKGTGKIARYLVDSFSYNAREIDRHMEFAIMLSDLQLLQHLLDRGEPLPERALSFAVGSFDLPTVRFVLAQDPDLAELSDALNTASWRDHPEITRCLLEHAASRIPPDELPQIDHYFQEALSRHNLSLVCFMFDQLFEHISPEVLDEARG